LKENEREEENEFYGTHNLLLSVCVIIIIFFFPSFSNLQSSLKLICGDDDGSPSNHETTLALELEADMQLDLGA